MNKLIFIIALIFVGRAEARQADSTRMYDLSKKIFIEPLALIDDYNMHSLRIGVEWPVVKDVCSVFGMVGIYPHQPAPYYGQYMRAGIKIYSSALFRKSTNDRTMYLSLHFFAKSQWFSKEDVLRDTSQGPSKEHVSYEVRKRSFGFHLEIGDQLAYRHICFEPFIGLGLRQSTVVNPTIDSLQGSLFHYNEDQATNIGNSSKYNTLLPSLSAGIRLSYLFKSKPTLTQQHGILVRIKRIITRRKK